MKILAGDIGGTKSILAIRQVSQGGIRTLLERTFESGSFQSADELLGEFLHSYTSGIEAACLAVAGVIENEQGTITNLGWKVDAVRFREQLRIPRVRLVNDFYAVAAGVPLLGGRDLVTVNEGEQNSSAPIAILGAGTGLGEAFAIPVGSKFRLLPSEGGHSDFAPIGEEQETLLAKLRAETGHVSYERVLSGGGLRSIYQMFAGPSSITQVPLDGSAISELADGGDGTAEKTFNLFVDVYGAEAGNLALKVLAFGGVFIAGGIASKNVSRFTDGRFLRAFVNKGRFGSLLARMPLHVVINQEVGLIGASALARELLPLDKTNWRKRIRSRITGR